MSEDFFTSIETAIGAAADQTQARVEDQRCLHYSQTALNLAHVFVSRFPGKKVSESVYDKIDSSIAKMVNQSKGHEGVKCQCFSQSARNLEQTRLVLFLNEEATAPPRKNAVAKAG